MKIPSCHRVPGRSVVQYVVKGDPAARPGQITQRLYLDAVRNVRSAHHEGAFVEWVSRMTRTTPSVTNTLDSDVITQMMPPRFREAIDTALLEFVKEVRPRLDGAGDPEAQLSGPLEAVFKRAVSS